MLLLTSFHPFTRNQLLSRSNTLFSQAILAHIKLGSVLTAFQYGLWSKSRLAPDDLATHRLSLDDRTNKLNNRVKAIQREIQALAAEMSSNTDGPGFDQNTQSEKLRTLHHAYLQGLSDMGIAQTEPLKQTKLFNMLSAIPKTSILIMPIVTEHGTVIFTIPGGTQKLTKQHYLILDHLTRYDFQHWVRGSSLLVQMKAFKYIDSYLNMDTVTANALLLPDTLSSKTMAYLPNYWIWQQVPDKIDSRNRWMKVSDHTLGQLNQTMMSPLLGHMQTWSFTQTQDFDQTLERINHLIWVPDSDMALLPLHAIEHQGSSLIDKYHFSYIPSLSVWHKKQQALIKKPVQPSLAAIINPNSDASFQYAIAESKMKMVT